MQTRRIKLLNYRILTNELFGPGTVVSVNQDLAKALVNTGQAVYAEEELRTATVEPVTRRATKVQAQRRTDS
jgi:hypothetical protein